MLSVINWPSISKVYCSTTRQHFIIGVKILKINMIAWQIQRFFSLIHCEKVASGRFLASICVGPVMMCKGMCDFSED